LSGLVSSLQVRPSPPAAPCSRSRFGRNVWLVARGNVLAQALPVLAAPLLTRLYSPSDFGVLAVFASALGIGLAVATARFEWSVPNTRSPALAAALLVLGAGGLALSAVLVTFGWGLLDAAALPRDWAALSAVGWMLPLALLGAGLQQLLQAWHVRVGELSALGRSRVTQSAANVAVALAAAGFGVWGLVLGVLAGSWVGLLTLWRAAEGLTRGLRRLTGRRVALAWRRFRAEAAWSTLASALNSASFAIVPLLLARHYGVVEVGYYALVQRLALGPIGLLGAAVSQSFWAEAAQLVRSDIPALERLYLRSSGQLAMASLPLALFALAGPLYVGPIFGSEAWQAAGWVLAATVPMLVGQAVASPLSHLIIHRRQRWQAAWDLVRVVLLAGTIEWMGAAGASFAWTVFGLSSAVGAMYLVLFALNMAALRTAVRRA